MAPGVPGRSVRAVPAPRCALARRVGDQQAIERQVDPALDQSHDGVDLAGGDPEPGRELAADRVAQRGAIPDVNSAPATVRRR
jgi:hypothetical protein